MGDFVERMRELAARVGVGSLTGVVEFDQPYAHVQHEDLEYVHDRGGPLYLRRAMFEHIPVYMEILAETVLEDPERSMIGATEWIAKRAVENAPARNARYIGDLGTLKASDSVVVKHDGGTVYHRPASRARLTGDEIAAINEELQISPAHWYGRWPKVIGT